MCSVTELSLSLDPGRGGLGLFFGALTTNIHGVSEAMRRTRFSARPAGSAAASPVLSQANYAWSKKVKLPDTQCIIMTVYWCVR